MIRIVLIFALMVVIYCVLLIGTAFMSGAVTQDDLDALFGEAPTQPVNQLPEVDELNATARLLKDREELLNEREAALDAEADRVEQEKVQLQKMIDEYEALLIEINTALDADDERRQQSYKDISDSLKNMAPENAAETLIAMMKEQPDVVPFIVKEISARDRGKILDEVDADTNKDLFLMLQAPAY